LHERALATARKFDVREFEGEELRHAGEIALAQGEIAAARAHFRNALANSREIGNQHEIVLCLEAVATLMAKSALHGSAARLCGAADAMRHAIATPRAYSAREQHDATMTRCLEALGEVAASAAVAAGVASPSDLAIANAFAWIDKP
jgi:hypothetical protein